jgi:hypothetical protein
MAIATVKTRINKVSIQTERFKNSWPVNFWVKCKNNPRLTITPLTVKIHNAAKKGNLFKRIGGKE